MPTKRKSRTYPSKTTEGINYESIVPGAKTTPTRIDYEMQLRKRKRDKRKKFKGMPWDGDRIIAEVDYRGEKVSVV